MSSLYAVFFVGAVVIPFVLSSRLLLRLLRTKSELISVGISIVAFSLFSVLILALTSIFVVVAMGGGNAGWLLVGAVYMVPAYGPALVFVVSLFLMLLAIIRKYINLEDAKLLAILIVLSTVITSLFVLFPVVKTAAHESALNFSCLIFTQFASDTSHINSVDVTPIAQPNVMPVKNNILDEKEELREETVNISGSCNKNSLYGFPYYLETNTQTACYKNYKMTSADVDTLIPLEGVSREISQDLIPNIVVEEDFDFAFDKNNFYINGDIVYSVNKKTFEVTRIPEKGQNGAIIVNGRGYTVTMTGFVGATLK